MSTYAQTKERVYLVVAVDIWHTSRADRRDAIVEAKENVCSVKTFRVAEPRSARVVPKAKWVE